MGSEVDEQERRRANTEFVGDRFDVLDVLFPAFAKGFVVHVKA